MQDKCLIGQLIYIWYLSHWGPTKIQTNLCVDPGIFVMGGPGQSDKKSSDKVFFFSPQLILQKSNGQFCRNLSFLKVPERVQHFPGGGGGGGGGNFFQGGVQLLNPYRNPYNL